MLTKRIIPCLDVKDGRTVKGVKFSDVKDVGDPVELALRYVQEGADELVFLDISATIERRKTLCELVERVAQAINIPFTVGGGVRSVADARAILDAGADKISVNSAAVENPNLIQELAELFGSQSVVVAIDARRVGQRTLVCTHSGVFCTEREVLDWAPEVQRRGAGEILLTSWDCDGTKKGFALELTASVSDILRIPVIASGGAGTVEHFAEVFKTGKADAALAASVFHFGAIAIPELKRYLHARSLAVRL